MTRSIVSRDLGSITALSLFAAFVAPAAPTGAQPAFVGLPPGLQPTEVDVTGDLSLRYGHVHEVAVNPRDPDNLVYIVASEQYTYACQEAGDPNCELAVPGQPWGLFRVPGWFVTNVFVSFDRGTTWAKVEDFPTQVPGKPPLEWQGPVAVAATADGTFYTASSAFHIESGIPGDTTGFYGCVAVSKSTDGGLTWSDPVCSGTPIDGPWLEPDLSTGRIYLGASMVLGPTSTADPNVPFGTINDRWMVASQDGVHWTSPQPVGGSDGVSHYSGGGGRISAAHGVLAAAFRATSAPACAFFVGGSAPCTVFQTSTDDGATWTRHRVPVPSDSTGTVQLAADPTTPGHYTVAVLNSTAGWFLVYGTRDSGNTWSGPTVVSDDTTKRKNPRPWMVYSPQGVLGLAWLTLQPGPGPTFPYNVWGAISDDGGLTFSDPLQISSADSPAPDPVRGDAFRAVFIDLDHRNAFVSWPDWRPGERSGFFSAVKLQAFDHPR